MSIAVLQSYILSFFFFFVKLSAAKLGICVGTDECVYHCYYQVIVLFFLVIHNKQGARRKYFSARRIEAYNHNILTHHYHYGFIYFQAFPFTKG